MEKTEHGPHGRTRTGTDGSAPARRLLHERLTRDVLGGFFRVYRALGSGFLESVYTRALEVELGASGLRVAREVPVTVRYRGVEVGFYRADLLVDDMVLVEVKAAAALATPHEQQTLNYLSATRLEVGLLLNFGPRPAFRRLLLTNDRKRSV